ncbi:hypothetical protein [Archangium sp.]|uniref:hypothetical protein n=1 Tax=Archangium sp. TaxID=1872627 RepID=UPI002D6D578F|nr:hypothetical protein [Archangium sp.]HYO54049.1 hypothetical protein [Archangium sp.]
MRRQNVHMLGSILAVSLAGAAFAGEHFRERDGAMELQGQPARESEAAAAKKKSAQTAEPAFTTLATTHYLAVPSEAFLPGRTADYSNSFGYGGACLTSGSNAMVAPIYLPHEATITGFKVYFSDDAPTTDISVSLMAHSLTAGYSNLATIDSSGITGWGNKSVTLSTAVNNTLNAYVLRAFSSAWSCNMEIRGALITYTTP